MVVMRLVILVVLAGCWRGGEAARSSDVEQPSFVMRIHGLAELQRSTAAVEPKLSTATDRIFGLVDEAQRDTLRDDLRVIADEVDRLAVRARTLRARGGNRFALDHIDRKLDDAVVTLAKLRHGLRYANTLEELQAYQPVDPAARAGWRHIGVADFNLP